MLPPAAIFSSEQRSGEVRATLWKIFQPPLQGFTSSAGRVGSLRQKQNKLKHSLQEKIVLVLEIYGREREREIDAVSM